MDIQAVSRLNKFLSLAACSLALSGAAQAIPIVVDGIKSAGEYTGGDSGQKSVVWWNGHESIYTEDAGNMNPLHWKINGNDIEGWSLNVFFEVPSYARRMIWSDDNSNIDATYLAAYVAGTHHKNLNMSYGTQTGSEYFLLNTAALDPDYDPTHKVDQNNPKYIPAAEKIMWQDEDTNGLGDDFTWATSREYIIAKGLGDTTESLQYDITASIELMWDSLGSRTEAIGIIGSVDNMELHMSDEAVGLPSINVPESGSSLLMLGIGIAGVAVYRKRRAS